MKGIGCTRIDTILCNATARHALQLIQYIYINTHRFDHVPILAVFNVQMYSDYITTPTRPIPLTTTNINDIPHNDRNSYTEKLNQAFLRIW